MLQAIQVAVVLQAAVWEAVKMADRSKRTSHRICEEHVVISAADQFKKKVIE
jgi:hypothetical protein